MQTDRRTHAHGPERVSLQDRTDFAHLDGLGLVEAFRSLVLGDLKLIELGERIVRAEDEHREVFSEGRYPGFVIEYRWPLDVGSRELARRFLRTGLTIVHLGPAPPEPEPSTDMFGVSELIVTKLKALREALVAGDLIASGTYEKSGAFGPIDRLQWAREGLLIDVKSGDLLRETDREPQLLWSGIGLSTFHVNTPQHAGVRSNDTEPSSNSNLSPATAKQESIEAAISALWPAGMPRGLSVKARDAAIMDWQRKNGLEVAGTKSIQRFMKANAPAKALMTSFVRN